MMSHLSSHLTEEQLGSLAEAVYHGRGPSENGAAVQAGMQTHLDNCAECRRRFAQFTELLDRVQAAPRNLEPPLDLWPAVRTSIEARVTGSAEDGIAARALHNAHRFEPIRGLRRSWGGNWLAAAAALLVAASISTAAFLLGKRSDQAHASVTTVIPDSNSLPPHLSGDVADAAAGALTSSLNDSFDSADEHTEQELLIDLEMRRSTLRPETSAEIDSNLKVIDQAIAELRAASARDPKNLTLKQLLAVSREQKVELLKQTENAS